MQFTKIDDAPLRANNLSKTGAVYYWMWHDTNENSYVQISHLSGGRGKNNGTFSKYLFALDDIGMKKTYTGYNPTDASTKTVCDNNMSGYLRAIRDDVIRRSEEQVKSGAL